MTPLLTDAEVAELCRVSRETVKGWRQRGRVRAIRLPNASGDSDDHRSWRFPADWLAQDLGLTLAKPANRRSAKAKREMQEALAMVKRGS